MMHCSYVHFSGRKMQLKTKVHMLYGILGYTVYNISYVKLFKMKNQIVWNMIISQL